MRTASTLRFLRALLATNLKASFALRGAFWLQAAFMAVNDLAWLAVWLIFFRRFESLGGWRLSDFMVLHGVLALSFGLAVVAAGGVRELARTIHDGDLDVFLTQPKPALLHVVASKTRASGWGDMAYGILVVALSGRAGPAIVPELLAGVLCGTTVAIATAVIVHSLAFWLGPVQSIARQSWEFLIVFAGYPDTIFSGFLRTVLFTLIPAAFAGWLPAAIVRDFTWAGLLAALGGAALYATIAVAVFRAGLRRYASGSRFGVRA